MGMTVKINAVDRTEYVDAKTLRINDEVTDKVNTASFDFICQDVALAPTAGETVLIEENSTKLFSGRVLSKDENFLPPNLLKYSVECIDHTRDLDKKLVSESYVDQLAGNIIKDIVNKYTRYETSPTGHNDPDTQWDDETNAYDGYLSTYAHDGVPALSWGNFLELNIDSTLCSSIYFFAGNPDITNITQIDVDVYYGDAWHHVYQGVYIFQTWEEKSLGGNYLVTQARVKFYNSHSSLPRAACLYEFNFGVSVFTTTNVSDGPTISEISFDYVQVSDAITKIAEICGYEWYVDYDKDIYFFFKSDYPAPFQLDDNQTDYKDLTIDTDISQIRNRVYVKSSSIVDTFGEIFIGDGVTKSQVCKYKAEIMLPTALETDILRWRGNAVEFSNSDTYLAVGLDWIFGMPQCPDIRIFKRDGDTFTKIDDPDTLPTGNVYGVSWSSNDVYLAAGHEYSPRITIYKRDEDEFTKLDNPAILPTGDGNGLDFGYNDTYLAIAHKVSPYITIYKRAADVFTKLSNPGVLPTGTGYDAAFSPDGIYLAVVHAASPYITIYKRSNDTFTKLDNPADLPADDAYDVAFSPDGVYLAVGHTSSPYITIYKRAGDVFTKLANPADLPTGYVTGVAFAPNTTHLATVHDNSPYITLYKRGGDAFVKVADPSPLPTGDGLSVAFSYRNIYIAVGHKTDPRLTIYKHFVPLIKEDGVYKTVGWDGIDDPVYFDFMLNADTKVLSLGTTVTPWEVDTAWYENKYKDVGTQDTSPRDVAFSSDGTKMYIMGYNTSTVYQYTLSIAWDVNTATYADKSKDATAQDISIYGITFSSDGSKMYIMGEQNDTVFQYTLSTPWDVDTASYANKSKDVSVQDIKPVDVTFNPDGSKMYIMGNTNDTVYQYALSTYWDVSTATYADKLKNVSTQETGPYGIAFSSDGSKMYIVGTANDTVYQYTLSAAWDVNTATYADKLKNVSTQETGPLGVTFSSDGTKMYIMGNTNDTVFQYTLSTESTPPAADVELFLIYTVLGEPICFRRDDKDSITDRIEKEGGDGIIEFCIVDNNINSLEWANEATKADLLQNADPTINATFITNRSDIHSGQIITLDSTKRGIVPPQQFILQKVELMRVDTGAASNEYTSQYPPEQSLTYVKATEYYLTQYPHLTTDPTISLTGSGTGKQWESNQITNQRFHIDLGSAKTVRRIYYENAHDFGANTTMGVQNFTFWGSNIGAGTFDDLVWGNDEGWTELTVAQNTFDAHIGEDQADPKYIVVTNSTAYRYYAFKFADNYGNGSLMCVRRIELQTEDPPTMIYVYQVTIANKFKKLEDLFLHLLDKTDVSLVGGAAAPGGGAPAGDGVSTFLGLTDTPANYAGSANKFAKVNAGETALEYGTNTDTEVADAVTKKHTQNTDTVLDMYALLSSDHTYSGLTDIQPVGESVVFGDLLYFNWTDKEWKKTDADAAATMPGLRIALQSKSDGQVCLMLVKGYIRDDSAFNFAGAMVYTSVTPGTMSSTAPAGTGDQVQRVGVARSADILFFDPSIDVGEI